MITTQGLGSTLKGRAILKSIRLEASAGQLTGIVGPNGAGKSTLLRCLAGLSTYLGQAQWKGQEISEIPERHFAKARALLSQSPPVPHAFKVRDILMMGRYPYFHWTPGTRDKEIVEQVIQDLQLQHLAERSIHQLSGGEQQLVHFARCLAQLNLGEGAERLLLLDEPINHLDLHFQYRLMEAVQSFVAKQHTALTVLHDLNWVARSCAHCIALKQGQVVAQGPPKEVLRGSFVRQLYNLRPEDQL